MTIRVPFSADRIRKGAAADKPFDWWQPPGKAVWPPFVIDSNEQTPWKLPGATRLKLLTGDYSCCPEHAPTRTNPGLVVIERKNPGDCWGVVGGGRKRFERELDRMQAIPFRLIVVEATGRSILKAPPREVYEDDEDDDGTGKKKRKLHKSQVMGTLLSWAHDLCPVQLWDDHACAAVWAARWLLKAHERACKLEAAP